MQKNQYLSLLLGSVVSLQAYAEVYMSDTQAAQLILPGQKLTRKSFDLSDSDKSKIEKDSGEIVRSSHLTLWQSESKDTVFIDQVLGKHEFITFAVGVNTQGKVTGLEILEYRESYGQQVMRPEWRKQFLGKDVRSPLKLDSDIKNISGATLSSAHVTAGVRRILHTYDTIRNKI